MLSKYFIFLFFLCCFINNTNANNLAPLIEKIKKLEKEVSCNQQYQDAEKAIITNPNQNSPDVFKEYIECIDDLVRRQSDNNKKMLYSVQLIVTPNEGKALDIVRGLNKVNLFEGAQARSVPYTVNYPGAARLNDGRYYKVIIGLYKNEVDAYSLLKNIKTIFLKNYTDAFVIKVP